MTLLPCARDEARPFFGDPPGPNEDELQCAMPKCGEWHGLQHHHVVRRSELGGAYRWVVVNGVVLLNERMLCRHHHDMVTGMVGGHRAWIRYLEGEGWAWYARAPHGLSPVASPPAVVLDKLGGAWLLVGPLRGV